MREVVRKSESQRRMFMFGGGKEDEMFAIACSFVTRLFWRL